MVAIVTSLALMATEDADAVAMVVVPMLTMVAV